MDNDRLEFLAQVASWYYEDNLAQETIAEKIDRSRSMVSRLLLEARDSGLIEIKVNFPLRRDVELEHRLQETFALTRAWVLAAPPANYPTLLRRLGKLGARCLQEHLHDRMMIGLGWGTALYEVVSAIPTISLHDTTVVQIIGSVGYGDPLVDGPELARWLAQKLNAAYRFLHAPLIVENNSVAQALRRDRIIAETLALARQIEVAMVGIGTVEPQMSSLQRAGYLSEPDLVSLRQAGVVGDILARQLDLDGNVADIPLNQRIIGLENLELLHSIPTVIAVAGGLAKAQGILAVLHGSYVNVLVTDAITASKVLALHEDNDESK